MVRYGKRAKRVALYLRVSTGEQTTKNQRLDFCAAGCKVHLPSARSPHNRQ